jgi:anti-anti-sigma factor
MEKWFVPSTRREINPTTVPLRSPLPNHAVVDLSVEPSGDACIVRVQTAKLTYPVLSSFFDAVCAIVEGGASKVVLDMEAVSYIDSETIGCLVEIHHLVTDRGGAIRLCGLQRRVNTMLSMTGVDRFLGVCAGEAEALMSLRQPVEGAGIA